MCRASYSGFHVNDPTIKTEIIAKKKYTEIVALYIFSVILLAMIVLLLNLQGYQVFVKYLFYQTSDTHYQFAIGYLIFLVVLILIGEEINKYEGKKFKSVEEAENPIQAALRVLINCDEK